MRNVVNNNYSNVTVEFAYHDGRGYAIAYANAEEGVLWMPGKTFEAKSRDEAELKALLYLINGHPSAAKAKEAGLWMYAGFNKNARLRLFGFTALEKGLNQKHKSNQELWAKVISLLTKGRDGLRFDVLSINDSYSKAILNAKGYCWNAPLRTIHAKHFAAEVKAAVKVAKAQKAAQAKAEAPAIIAKAEPSPKATAKKVVA